MEQSRTLVRFIERHQKSGRVSACFIPAAALTFGLFWVMSQLIEVKEVTLEAEKFRTLADIVLPVETQPLPEDESLSWTELTEVVPPPDNRKISKIEPGSLVFEISAPAVPVSRIPVGAMEPVRMVVTTIERERAIPVRHPVPDYPRRAQVNGLEGQCEVTFSIDAAGRPFGLAARCSDDVFARSSVQAVERALFAARVKNGVPVGQTNLVYPIHFELNE